MTLAIAWTLTALTWDRAEVVNRIADLRRVAVSLPFSVVDEIRMDPEAVAFIAHYHQGSESTLVALRLNASGVWSGQGQTKTLYAGRPQHGGDENFLCAHLSVVALLDAAQRMGFTVDVHDTGGFWSMRDIRGLVDTRRRIDRTVADIAGRVADAIRQHHGDEVEIPTMPSDEDIDRWKQNEAVAKLLDLVVRMRM